MNSILNELGILQDKKENSLLNNLTRPPPKEPRNMMPHTTASKIFAVEQADLLHLPNDDGYRYLLVVVDIASRLTDAEPLKNKESQTVMKALEKIYKRNIIKRPKRLEVDDGTEFKGAFAQHFKKFLDLVVKVAGRHRQQSVVETKNGQLGTILNKRMLVEEINNDATSRSWVDIVPDVIKLMNKHLSQKVVEPNPDIPPRTNKFSADVLDLGTAVRIQLDNPIGYVEGDKLHGKFRVGDIRWTKEVHRITRIFLRPNQPVMYQVDNNNKVAYTKYQLQVVKEDEVKPSSKSQRKFYAQEIISKRKVKGKVYYKVLWEDGDITEQDGNQVREELPDLLKDFNKRSK